jgi:hypothetical protein
MKFNRINRLFTGICGASAILILGLASRSASAGGLDRNNNGLNDAWEMLFQGSSLTPNEDSDGDGFSNLAESRAGTNPLDPTSFPAFAHRRRRSRGIASFVGFASLESTIAFSRVRIFLAASGLMKSTIQATIRCLFPTLVINSFVSPWTMWIRMATG